MATHTKDRLMSNTMNERRRNYLHALIADAEAAVAELEGALHDAGHERQSRLGDQISNQHQVIDRTRRELKLFDMEAPHDDQRPGEPLAKNS